MDTALCHCVAQAKPDAGVSNRDRSTSSYEMVFLLAKQGKYFYDAEAVRQVQPNHDGGLNSLAVDLESTELTKHWQNLAVVEPVHSRQSWEAMYT